LIERLVINQGKRRSASPRGLQRPGGPLALYIPAHLPIADFGLVPEMRGSRRDQETVFQLAGGRQVGILEAAILNQFGVQAAFAGVADLFEEDAVETRGNARAEFFGVYCDAPHIGKCRDVCQQHAHCHQRECHHFVSHKISASCRSDGWLNASPFLQS
jgi:hypothetical protein